MTEKSKYLNLLTEKVCNKGGYSILGDSVNVEIDDNGRLRLLQVCAVAYKFEQFFCEEINCNLVLIDDGFHCWDIDVYLTAEQIKIIYNQI